MMRQLFYPERIYNIQPYQEQPNEQLVGHVQQDVRHYRRLNRRPIRIDNDQRHLEFAHYIKEKIPKHLINIFKVLLNMVFAYWFYILVCEITILPLANTEHGKRKYEYKSFCLWLGVVSLEIKPHLLFSV